MKKESEKKQRESLLPIRDAFLEIIDEMELEENIIMTAGIGVNKIVALLSRELKEEEAHELGLPSEVEGVNIQYTYLGGVADSHKLGNL